MDRSVECCLHFPIKSMSEPRVVREKKRISQESLFYQAHTLSLILFFMKTC